MSALVRVESDKKCVITLENVVYFKVMLVKSLISSHFHGQVLVLIGLWNWL